MNLTLKAPQTTDFLQATGAFDLAPKEALAFFQGKGLKTTFAWQDFTAEQHAKAFTIAKMADIDMLADAKKIMDKAIAQGLSLGEFKAILMPELKAKGWWGKQEVTDPKTGQTVMAQLGSSARLETIFRTNMMTAYSAGAWQKIEDQKAEAPWLLYDAVDDSRTRPEHRALDGVVKKVTDSYWHNHTPPLAWNCRCHVIQLSDHDLASYGIVKKPPPPETTGTWTNPRTGKTLTLPVSPETGRFVVEPGFERNPGKDLYKKLTQLAAEKAAADEAASAAIQAQALEAAQASQQDTADALKAAAAKALKDIAKELGPAELARSQNKAAIAAAQHQAAQALADIKAGKAKDPGKFLKQAHTKVSKIPGFENGSPKDQLDVVKAVAGQLKTKHAQLTKLSSYKAKVLAGKIPSATERAAFMALNDEEQAAFLAKIDAAKPKTDAPFDFASLAKIGEAKGSNAGGLYQDIGTGKKWYIKFPGSEDAARNEVLAGRLYKLAGVPNTAETHAFTTPDGKPGVASAYTEGLQIDPAALKADTKPAGTYEGFAADAWLANWDVAGTGFDNLPVKAGQAYRIDAGGALRYRAQGGPKGAAFGPTVPETESLRNPAQNHWSAAVFRTIDRDSIVAGIRKIAAISDADLEAAIAKYGPTDRASRQGLLDLLKARREDLLRQYPEARVPAPDIAPNIAPPRVTELDMVQIREARSNGYTMPTDAGEIEDEAVMIWTDRQNGKDYTRAKFKVRGERARLLSLAAENGEHGFKLKTSTNAPTREQDRGRVGDIIKAEGAFSGSINLSHFEGEAGSAKVRFWTSDKAPQAIRNTVELTLEGTGKAQVEQAFQAMEALGIDAKRATYADKEELYLNQILYARTAGEDAGREYRRWIGKLNENPDQASRIKALKDKLSADIGRDITTLKGYDPQGRNEAFGHGYVRRYRPDLPEKEWTQFQKDFRLHHAITTSKPAPEVFDLILNSGGKMVPTADKMFRGIRAVGMSPEEDMRSGGGDYFFTRIKQAGSKEYGFYWNARQLARLDAISYDGDRYGRTTGNTVTNYRQSTVADWIRIAKNSTNETIFKGGMSIFDELDFFRARDDTERQEIIAVFRKHGYNTWPDGRPLEQVIIL